jgi:membrane fusion protein (multidrug efflux system)
MWVYFNVPEAEYLNYQQGAEEDKPLEVSLMMANNQLFELPGIVETIEADFNNETGNIAFRATFQNPKKLLRNGETGNIIMKSDLKNALIIPQKATFEVLEKRYVYVIDKNNEVHAKEITIASEIQDLYIIKTGVTVKDKILVEGIRNVKENQKIKYTYENPKNLISKLKVYVE